MDRDATRLLVFAKAPVAGQVKTRLVPALGEKGAASFHEQLVNECLEKVIKADLAPVELWCSPDTVHPFFQKQSLPLFEQKGDDLGMKMANALREALTRCEQAILLGTDSPSLTGEILEVGLQGLQEGLDAVIVPAEDGGYVAIGMRCVDDELFKDIDWGSNRVYEQTVSKLNQLGWNWRQLETCWDIDRPDDLKRYENRNL